MGTINVVITLSIGERLGGLFVMMPYQGLSLNMSACQSLSTEQGQKETNGLTRSCFALGHKYVALARCLRVRTMKTYNIHLAALCCQNLAESCPNLCSILMTIHEHCLFHGESGIFSANTQNKFVQLVPHKASIRSGTCVGSKGYSAWQHFFCAKLHGLLENIRRPNMFNESFWSFDIANPKD